ncbi:MAG: tyrosine-type recombinase/integrase [Clostridia bacterium]|nr:tyrosine-type recombinase/integrase [Clostridia bacterium]
MYNTSYVNNTYKSNVATAILQIKKELTYMNKEKRTFEEVTKEWLDYQEDKVSHASLGAYKNRLATILPIIGAFDVGDNQIEPMLSDILKDSNPRTKGAIMQLVKRVIAFAEKGYEAKSVPKEKEDIELIPKEEFDILKEYVTKNVNPNNLGIICVMYTGLKIGELCSLKWSDIDLTRGIIHVRKNMKRVKAYEGDETKTIIEEININPRDIPIPTKLIRLFLSNSRRLEQYLVTGTINSTEPRTLLYRLQAICRKLGIKKITYNNIRDYFAVNALQNGINSLVLAEILGIEYCVTQKYSNLARKYIDPEMEVEKLNNI